MRSLGNGSVVKNTCSCRGPGFDMLALTCQLYKHLSLHFREIQCLSDLCGNQACMWYIDTYASKVVIHIKINLKSSITETFIYYHVEITPEWLLCFHIPLPRVFILMKPLHIKLHVHFDSSYASFSNHFTSLLSCQQRNYWRTFYHTVNPKVLLTK